MNVFFNIARVLVLLFALLLLVMGMQWLFMPQNMTEQFALLPNGILGWATLRADLGAFFTTAGATALLGASRLQHANAFLFCSGLLMGMAALGRLVGFVMDGIPARGLTPLIFELSMLAALVALASLRMKLARHQVPPA